MIEEIPRGEQPVKHGAAMEGISRRYFFIYEFEVGEAGARGAFTGMRACCFGGIWEGEYYSAEQIKKMLGFELSGAFLVDLHKGIDSGVAQAT